MAPPDVKRKRGPKDPSSFKLFSTELTTLAQIAREVADEEADNRTVAPLPRSALLVDMERSSSATTMLEVCLRADGAHHVHSASHAQLAEA